MRRLGTLGAALAALGWLGLALPAWASPATAAECLATPGGVWVVVDFQGALTTGCAINPATGLAALQQVTSVVAPGGFVNQIAGQPAVPSGDPFIYWNYWHAGPSGAWGYSTEGAGTYVPGPGTIEGWSFGPTGTKPAWAPPAAPVRTPLPVDRRTSAATPLAPPSGTPIQESAAPIPQPSAAASGPTVPAADQTSAAPAEAGQSSGGAQGSPVETMAALGLVTAAGGGLAWWLRRRP